MQALYRQDIDNDGLWDITEMKTAQKNYVTSLQSHPTAGTPLPGTNSQFIRSPYYYENPNTDGDLDGLTDIEEQTSGTDLTKPDTDGDGLLDGWEVQYGLNPLVAGNDATADPDGDGLTNLQEYFNNTNPNAPNTDGSGGTDSQEVSAGSDPADAANDTAPPPGEMENMPIVINGDYTKWEVVITGLGPDDKRVRRFRMDNYNTAKSMTFPIRKGNSYEMTMIYQSTIPGQEVPWYCWEAKIDGKTDAGWLFKNHWVVNNSQGLLAAHTHSQGVNKIAGKKVTLTPLEILADTNRDGTITNDDRAGKDAWTQERGAIYAVNFDRDGNLTHHGRPVADSVMWWEEEGVPEHEDWKINGEADRNDITPIRVTVPEMPEGAKVYLVAKGAECVRSMHLYSRIKADGLAIWGGFTDAGKPWTDDDDNPLDIEISKWLKPVDGESGDDASNEKIRAGDYEFGVEGLLFRGMKVADGTLNGGFGGYLEFSLEVQFPDESERNTIGSVKMKVAPFLLTHNDRPTDQVFVQAIPLTGLAEPSEDPQNPTPVMPKAARLDTNVVNQWMQDHVEIGYTQRPGGPVTVMTLACPYARGMAEWARDQLLANGKGVFALSSNLEGSTGDFGGNIELTHPQTNASLGKIIVGNNASVKLRNFFIAQEEQPLVAVNVDFADVAHVDEVLSFGPNNTTYFPDPAAALQHLRDTYTTPQSRLEAVLFSTDLQRAKTTTVFATVQNPQQHYIITSLDYDTHQAEWQPYVDGRLRIVGSNAAGGAQVAYIESISKATAADNPAANVAGKMKITVAEVWNTAQTNPNSRAMQDWNVQTGAPQADWHASPTQGATIVCVKKSLFWRKNCPAVITVEELLNDTAFTNFNEIDLPPLIQAAATSSGAQNTTSIPCLFFQQLDVNRPNGWKSVALMPNAVNLQWVDGVPVMPLPFGPRNQLNVDTIQQLHTNLFPNTPPVFLNDWFTFHTQSGEVHCGSSAKRVPIANWWNH